MAARRSQAQHFIPGFVGASDVLRGLLGFLLVKPDSCQQFLGLNCVMFFVCFDADNRMRLSGIQSFKEPLPKLLLGFLYEGVRFKDSKGSAVGLSFLGFGV